MTTPRPLGSPVLFVGTGAPTATDDAATLGVRAGYWWMWDNGGAAKWWVCRSPTTGAAVWDEVPRAAALTTLYQPLDSTLTALAGLDATAGLVEQTGADAFTKRAIGVATSSSIPTRADADSRFAAIGHVGAGGAEHPAATTSVAGFMSASDKTKLNGIGAGASVTSVALSVPSIFSLSGSPITTSGTLTVTLANQTANLIFAGPSSGGAAAPTFRSLVAADIPAHDWSKITSGKPTTLGGYGITDAQPLEPTLTGLAAIAGTAGLVEQTSADVFAIRAIGVAAATSIPTRGNADSRYHALDFMLVALSNYIVVRASATVTYLASALSVTRSAAATALAADGATVVTYSANALRLNAAGRAALAEGARTNNCTRSNNFNSTGWSRTGVTVTTGITAPDGSTDACTVAFSAGAVSNLALNSSIIALPTSTAAPSTSSIWMRPTTPGDVGKQINFIATRSGFAGGGLVTITLLAGWNRYTLTQAAIAETVLVLTTDQTLGVGSPPAPLPAVSVDLWGAQVEAGAFASSYIPTTGSAVTRDADIITEALTAAGVAAGGPFTVLIGGMLPQVAPSGADQTIVQIDDGSNSNRYRLRNVAGGATVVAGRVTAGASSDATSLGSITAGAAYRAGIAVSAGRIAGALNGGAVQAITGGVTSGLTTLRIGTDASGAAGMFGEVEWIVVLPYALSDDALSGLTGGSAWSWLGYLTAGAGLTGGGPISASPSLALTGSALLLHSNTTGPGVEPLDVPRASELGSAAFADIDALRGQFKVDGDSNLQVLPQHGGCLIVVTSGTRTHTLPDAADVPLGWSTRWKNRSGNNVTINRASTNTIDAAATSYTLATGASISITKTSASTWEST